MADYRSIERRLTECLELRRRPIAVAFRDAIPAGVAAFSGSEPSGCSFWRLAAAGRAFYTVPADHYTCPIGAHTHGLAMPPSRAGELEATLSLMAGIGYIKMEEVPAIPRLSRPPAAIVYAPLGETPVDPDVAMVVGRPGRLMLLNEAAARAGVAAQGAFMGRPTCMVLPASFGGGLVGSAGCVGNRIYTDLGDDEVYVAIAGRDLIAVVDALSVIEGANAMLSEYHRGRRASLATE
jgi:uncharacterized protein (DUF169 family)